MKKPYGSILLSAVVILAILTAGSVKQDSSGTGKDESSPLGTWKLELYKYDEGSSYFYNRPSGQPRIKLISDKYFTWVTIDSVSGRIISAAGGPFTLEGNNYTEFIEYGFGMDNYLKTSSTYKIKIEDDILFLSGNLTGYNKIEEIWQRIK